MPSWTGCGSPSMYRSLSRSSPQTARSAPGSAKRTRGCTLHPVLIPAAERSTRRPAPAAGRARAWFLLTHRKFKALQQAERDIVSVMILDLSKRHIEPDITVFELRGRLALGNRLSEAEHSIRTELQSGCRKLLLDLGGLEFIDSAGLGLLVMCAGQMEQTGGRMCVAT